ncbi:nitrate ABC transporter ATP-binding protein [Clostridia bacterium]|nr:nitrate ABC transporter ATP-binding protein [Clostridia bacterium]
MKLTGVSFSYGETVIFDKFDGEFADRKITCVLGPSGCGKTTLLYLLAGLYRPQSGGIEGAGRPSCVFQEPRLIPQKTAVQNLDFVLRKPFPDKAERENVIDGYLTLAGLHEARNLYPHELSGGMAGRLSLIRAFAYPSDTLLLDEPFGGLDAELKRRLTGEFLKLWERERRTVIFVTHDVDEALIVGDCARVYGGNPMRLKKNIDLCGEKGEGRLYGAEADRAKREIFAALDAQ